MADPRRMYTKKFSGSTAIATMDAHTYELFVSTNTLVLEIRRGIRLNKNLQQIADELKVPYAKVLKTVRQYRIPYDSRFTTRRPIKRVESEEVKASKREKMQAFLKQEHQNVWHKGKPMEKQEQKLNKERVELSIGGIKVTYPKWHDEVRMSREAGVSQKDLAAKYNVSVGRISQIVSPNWPAYLMRSADKPFQKEGTNSMSRKPVGDYIKKYREAQDKGEITMPDRTFTVVRHPDVNDKRNGLKIRCGNCDNTQTFYKLGVISHTHAARVFREKGWLIGASARADRCPACASGIGHYKPKEEPKAIPVVPEPERKPAAFPVEVAVPEPVIPAIPVVDRDQTREDRRLINMRLNEVYGENCYQAGWTDEKVAADLGVPVKWITDIREDMFGPEFDVNARKIAELSTAMDALKVDLDNLNGKRKIMMEKIEQLFAEEVAPLVKRLSELRESLNALVKK